MSRVIAKLVVRAQRYTDGAAASEFNHRLVTHPGWLQQHHIYTRLHKGHNRLKDRALAARGDDDIRLRIHRNFVLMQLFGDRFQQRRCTRAGSIVSIASVHRSGGGLANMRA